MLTLLLNFVIFDLILIGLAIPLMMKKIKPNYFYGFRVRKTLQNEDIWYEVNQYAARYLLATGLISLPISIGLYFIPNINVDDYAWLCLAAFVLPFTISLIQSLRLLNSIKGE
ncbi:MAG: SdpI family protein [Anaerolineaceae bacterium]|nr:SdpI family protein [Anaerolineaceae bacterium]